MANKSELKLADGSRWSDDTNPFVTGDHSSGRVENHPRFGTVLSVNFPGYMPLPDALAAIRAVDGDPEHLELVEIREKLAAVELERDAAFAQCQRREQWASEAARLSIENEAMSARCAALVRRTQVEVYDEGFSAGFEAAEKALGLNYTHVVEHENPYRKTSNNG